MIKITLNIEIYLRNLGTFDLFTGKDLPFRKRISYLDKEYKKQNEIQKMRNIPRVPMLRLFREKHELL